ncbi:protein jagged-1-like [Macrobrachium nipponense]|uniref:protein jagged-1-like n=1 Tax=Macrobrachium nipponense TaxID=159736 RepID=UPI0030C86B46
MGLHKMLDTSWKWGLLVFSFSVVNVCLAEVNFTKLISSQEVCSLDPTVNIGTSLPTSDCCSEPLNNRSCSQQYNGRCMLKWSTGSCPYTVDVCSSEICTCCGSCSELNTNSQCKLAGGRCARICSNNEYNAWWIPCHHGCCKCCRKKCELFSCANGRGYCSPTGQCGRGYYPSGFCSGFDCTCCVHCQNSIHCYFGGGFCEWNKRACPRGYFSGFFNCCPDPECRCCYRWPIPLIVTSQCPRTLPANRAGESNQLEQRKEEQNLDLN